MKKQRRLRLVELEGKVWIDVRSIARITKKAKTTIFYHIKKKNLETRIFKSAVFVKFNDIFESKI